MVAYCRGDRSRTKIIPAFLRGAGMKTEAPITEERTDQIMKIIVINGPMGVGKTTAG